MTNRRRFLHANARTRRRNAPERRFRTYGLAAISVSIPALFVLLTSVLGNGLGALRQTFITLLIPLDAAVLNASGTLAPEAMKKVTTIGYARLIQSALADAIAENALSNEGLTVKQISGLPSQEAPATLRNTVLANPAGRHHADRHASGKRSGGRLLQGPRQPAKRCTRQQHLDRTTAAGR